MFNTLLSKSSEDQKKSPKIIQRSNADYSQIIGWMQSNYWGGYIPPIPPGFWHPWSRLLSGNHYSLLICRYNCIMMPQVTVTIMANCNVITIAYRC